MLEELKSKLLTKTHLFLFFFFFFFSSSSQVNDAIDRDGRVSDKNIIHLDYIIYFFSKNNHNPKLYYESLQPKGMLNEHLK